MDNFLEDILHIGDSLYFVHCNIDLIERCLMRADIVYEAYFTECYIWLDSLEEKELGFV